MRNLEIIKEKLTDLVSSTVKSVNDIYYLEVNFALMDDDVCVNAIPYEDGESGDLLGVALEHMYEYGGETLIYTETFELPREVMMGVN